MSERKAVIKNADMLEEMQQDAVDCATLEKYNIEKDIAAYIKKDGTGRHLAVQVRLNESDVIVSVVADVIRVEYSQWLQISLPGDYTSTRQQWERYAA